MKTIVTAVRTGEQAMRRILIPFILLVVCSSGAALASTWGQAVTINGYYVYDSGSAYITTSGNQNPDACPSSAYLYLDTSAPFFKELYAAVMVAQATGSTVSLLYEGCVGPYPKIRTVVVPHVW